MLNQEEQEDFPEEQNDGQFHKEESATDIAYPRLDAATRRLYEEQIREYEEKIKAAN